MHQHQLPTWNWYIWGWTTRFLGGVGEGCRIFFKIHHPSISTIAQALSEIKLHICKKCCLIYSETQDERLPHGTTVLLDRWSFIAGTNV